MFYDMSRLLKTFRWFVTSACLFAIAAPLCAQAASGSFLIAGKETPAPPNQIDATTLKLYPILSLSTSQTQGTSSTSTTDQSEIYQRLNPDAKKLVDESVAAGHLPTDQQLKKFPPDMKELILAEVERQLLAKQQTQEQPQQQNGNWFNDIFSEYGVQFLALLVSLVGVILAISGFSLANSKKKKHIAKFMNEIDDAFNSFKWKSKRCEAELYRMHDIIEEKLKEGKLDESSYQLLSTRIEKYLKEIQDVDGIPNSIKYAAMAEEQKRMKGGMKMVDEHHHQSEEDDDRPAEPE